jgi:hypothetical protein
MKRNSLSKKSKNATDIIVAASVSAFVVLMDGFLERFHWFEKEASQIASFNDRSSLDKLIDLKGEWSFNTGDQAQWSRADFDHSEWQPIDVPSKWENEGFREYDGYAWYRTAFDIGSLDIDTPLFLKLGQIDDSDEVFINGRRIGSSGRFPLLPTKKPSSCCSAELMKPMKFFSMVNVLGKRVRSIIRIERPTPTSTERIANTPSLFR